MKKATIVFAILFIITLLVPLIAVFKGHTPSNVEETTTGKNELVTIFGAAIHEQNCRLRF